jgi:hypothetical protein
MRAIVRLRNLVLTTGVLFSPIYALSEPPPNPDLRQTGAQPSQDSEFRRAMIDLNLWGEDASILSQQSALRPFSQASVASLLLHENRYIKALAISELKERGDKSHRTEISKLFRETSLGVNDLKPDPQDNDPLAPDAALTVAAAEYLAAVDKVGFLPILLDRRETWVAPHWFAPAFRQMGQGWIRSALNSCRDAGRRSGLGFLIRAGATADNVAELQEVLATENSGIWLGAVVACERLDDASCWTALEASLDRHDALDRLTARMAQWRKQRTRPEDLFAAAESVAQLALKEAPGPGRARMWNALDQFVHVTAWTHLTAPRSLTISLRALGSPVIAKDLDAAGIE